VFGLVLVLADWRNVEIDLVEHGPLLPAGAVPALAESAGSPRFRPRVNPPYREGKIHVK
jgi:hypothetical protein